ncbi:MAG: hypothetical protein LPK08_02485 [Halomonas sp.]|nr:hypothetical protein [Halomonas sp.]
MRLVPEARKMHKLWSVRLAAAAAVIAALEPALPTWEGILPEWAHAALVSVVAMSAVVARVIPQMGIHDDQ